MSVLSAASEATVREFMRLHEQSFLPFAEEFVRVLAQNELQRTASGEAARRIREARPSWSACRRGQTFVQDQGPQVYKAHTAELCSQRFPSEWTFDSGRASEHRTTVDPRTCEAFFKAPRGCVPDR